MAIGRYRPLVPLGLALYTDARILDAQIVTQARNAPKAAWTKGSLVGSRAASMGHEPSTGCPVVEARRRTPGVTPWKGKRLRPA